MAKNKQTRKLRIATLLLSVIMVVAACSFFITACSTSSDKDDSSTTETRTDTQTFANGNFEYFSDSDGSYRIGSPESWTSSTGSNGSGVSASSSVAKSGIVDTSIDWTEFVNAFNTYTEYKDADDEDKPDPYYTDIDNNYDIPGWDLAKVASGDEDPADDALKTSAKDLNPGTPFATKESEDETNGTHVLMLHNYRSNKMGTAARYTSSTVTLAAGTAAQISVWVKTSGLTYNDGTPVNGNRGAYVRINSTVGGKTQDPLVVRNIDTSSVADTENNGWEQFTFYINASPYATTTFSVELGLGMQAEGKETNYLEYVQGYAFFDDLKYTVMQSADFDQKIASVPAGQAFTLNLAFDSDLEKLDANSVTSNVFSLNLNTTNLNTLTLQNVTAENTVDSRGQTISSAKKSFASQLLANYDQDMARSGIKNVSDFTQNNGYAAKFIKDFEKFNSLPFGGAEEDILVLYSSKGAPYTAALDSTDTSSMPFELGKDESMLFSFWVKTSDLQGGTGATVTVIDGDSETSIGAVDTTTLTSVDLVDDQKKVSKEELEKYEDIFDGWQQCFFFLTNSTDETKTFSLEFSYGLKDFSGTTISSYTEGYAAFTGLRWQKLTEEEYAIKTTGTYAVEVSLTGSETSVSNSFDDVATTDQTKIKTNIANLKNYTGVYGNSTYVGGTQTSGINKNANAGVINKDYTAADREAGTGYSKDLAWVQTLANAYDIDLTSDGVLNSALWNAAFGDDLTQPLLITNQEAQSYGYFANSSTNIAASSFAEITVRMKLSAGATANVYLIDTADKEFGEKKYTDTLTFSSGVSYRYDSNGNVVTKDPDDKDFSSKTDTLFYKQSNGLWATAKDYNGNVWYANLANYAKDKDGNLIDSDKNIVYYASSEEGVYYRYKNDDGKLEVQVKDFSAAGVDAEKLAQARVQDKTNYGLSKQVTNTTSEVSDWIYVRFFIATGDESKDYRLEVWSGDRNGGTNPAGSFVIFDVVSASFTTKDGTPLTENLDQYAQSKGFTDSAELLKDYEKDPTKYITSDGADSLVYYNFSLFDDDDYKPFDADRSDSSDPYADYNPSSYSNSVAYFTYNLTSSGTQYYDTYVNFDTYEVGVAEASEDDSTTEDETTTAPDYNVWLLAASIILAAALIFTLIAILIRKLLANIRKKSVHNKPMYDNKRKRYIRKLKLEEAEREDDQQDDVLPDEDEISEEDIYKVDDSDTTDADSKTIEMPSDEENTQKNENSDEENK